MTKRFVRKQKDVPYIRPPMMSAVVKAIEDAWADVPGAVVGIDKHGLIQVKLTEGSHIELTKAHITYKSEAKLRFADEAYCWIIEASWFGAGAGDRSKVQVGELVPYPMAACSVPYMGDFHGHVTDIAELEAVVEEFRKAKAKVEMLLASEVEERGEK